LVFLTVISRAGCLMPGADAEDEAKARTGTVSHTREAHPIHTFNRPVEMNVKLYPK